jgi:hypothetical protein
MTNKEIAWEKWEDDIVQERIREDSKTESVEEDSLEESFLEAMENMPIQEIPKVVSTAVGIFEIYDRNKPSNQYDCWLGHTNFNISQEVKNCIENIEGVEVLKVLTRYRFFVGIAKMFDFKKVRVEIEKAACGKHLVNQEESILDPETRIVVDDIKSRISSQKWWAIYIFPNGQIDYISSDHSNDPEYLDKLQVFKSAEEYSGGLLLTREHQ